MEESYYAEVESHFVARRGSPLFITPGEWQLVWKWEQAGVPLRVVKEGIDRVFERPAAARRPRKLSYCRQTVEAAFRRFREASLGGDAPASTAGEEDVFDPAARLRELACDLSRIASRASDEVLRERTEAAAAELERMASDAGQLGWVEERLAELEREVVDGAERAVGDRRKEELRQEAERSLASYRERMPEKIYASALESAYRRRLRAAVGLPALTLLDR